MPRFAPRPVPTIMAVGVARPSEHGQAITSTATACIMAGSIDFFTNHVMAKVKIAITITEGTKTPAILSASLCTGALCSCASSTSFTICESMVSLPTLVASNFIKPFLFMVPPITSSPTVFSLGMDSPVTMASSMEVSPKIIFPSTATFSPGLTSIISPTTTSSMGISITSPSLSTTAVFACSSINLLMASVVLVFALFSKYFPRSIKVIITAEDS